MIKILNKYHNHTAQPKLVAAIQSYYDEARGLVPELPKDIKLYFYDNIIVPGYASGGFAYSPDTITIGFDDDYEDQVDAWKQLRGSVLHESYHLAQGFTGFDIEGRSRPMPSAIDQAIYEGAATVFERDYTAANKKVGWAEYLDDTTMLQWVKEIQNLTHDYDVDRWKFYDSKTNQRWILYRAGVFINDQAIQKSRLSILDLRHKTSQEILKLAYA